MAARTGCHCSIFMVLSPVSSLAGLFRVQQRHSHVEYFAHDSLRDFLMKISISCSPIEIFNVIGQDHTRRLQASGKGNFKRIALRLIGDRAYDRKAGFPVIQRRREYEARPAARLFPSRLRVQVEPNHVPSVWNVVFPLSRTVACSSWCFCHTTSPPTAGPVSHSPWRFSGVMPATS